MSEQEEIRPGDKVTFQGKTGKVLSITPDDDRIVVDVTELNGGSNVHYGHISQFRPVVVERADAEPPKHEAPEGESEAEAKGDE